MAGETVVFCELRPGFFRAFFSPRREQVEGELGGHELADRPGSRFEVGLTGLWLAHVPVRGHGRAEGAEFKIETRVPGRDQVVIHIRVAGADVALRAQPCLADQIFQTTKSRRPLLGIGERRPFARIVLGDPRCAGPGRVATVTADPFEQRDRRLLRLAALSGNFGFRELPLRHMAAEAERVTLGFSFRPAQVALDVARALLEEDGISVGMLVARSPEGVLTTARRGTGTSAMAGG